MNRAEEIQQKAKELAQQCFPDEHNIWARPNYEAQVIKAACMEICKWADQTMIDRACEFLKSYRQETPDGMGYIAGIVNDKTIEDFRKAMQDV